MTETETETKKGFLSKTRGCAHCCGHDAHMAMLLVAAKLLSEGKCRPRHNIRFIFQHAEEKAPGGAIELIEAGCLEAVDEVYAMHVIPPLRGGLFAVMEGPFMAAADEIAIRVAGKGGHAAMPHLVRDPVVATAAVIQGLQQIVSRRTSPMRSLVVSLCSVNAGSGTHNVIPDHVEVLGTVRTLDSDLRESAPGLISDCATAIARAHGCTADVSYTHGYPVLVNDAAAARLAREAVVRLSSPSALVPIPEPLMGGEDFARYAERRPSCYVFLGASSTEQGISAPNHAPDFDIDETVLPLGTGWFLELASGR